MIEITVACIGAIAAIVVALIHASGRGEPNEPPESLPPDVILVPVVEEEPLDGSDDLLDDEELWENDEGEWDDEDEW